MAETARGHILFMRGAYVAIAVLALFVALLPVNGATAGLPGPDLILCLSAVWVIRRPSYVPMLWVALVLLISDLILMQPPGLGAAISVLLVEFLRSRVAQLRSATFMQEWLSVSVLMAGAALIYRIAQWVAMLSNPPLLHDLAAVAMTIAVYPLVVAVSAALFNVRKVTPAEVAGQVRVS